MTTAPQPRRPGPGRRRALRWVHTLRTQLTRQFITRNRRMAFALSVVTIAIAVASVHVSAWWFSPGVMILPILAGGLLLWPRALRIFFGFAAVALIYDVAEGKAGAGIIATIVLTAAFADVLARTREKLGVQGLRGDRMLLELRDRIRAQGKLPELGEAWGSSLVLKPAGGSSFGGDFVVSYCDGKTLEVALVDVSGKGIDAGTRALLLSGAFGGLLGSVPREQFLPACNAYLRRRPGRRHATRNRRLRRLRPPPPLAHLTPPRPAHSPPRRAAAPDPRRPPDRIATGLSLAGNSPNRLINAIIGRPDFTDAHVRY